MIWGQQHLPQESDELGLTGEGLSCGGRPQPDDSISILMVGGSSRNSGGDNVSTVGPGCAHREAVWMGLAHMDLMTAYKDHSAPPTWLDGELQVVVWSTAPELD